MKTEEQSNFEFQIKFLHKKFRILDRPSTKILYQFCQFDAEKTYKILTLGKTMRNPAAIIEILMKNPQKSQQYLDSLVARYDSEVGLEVDLFIQKKQIKKAQKLITKLQFQFFSDVPEDTISSIMSYLDPYSFKSFSFTNSTINKVGKAQALSQLYKEICKVLFSMNQPVLPFICRFNSVKKFVIQHPEQYFPYYNNFKNAVTNNLRNYIWRMQPKDLKLDKDYYLSFGSYQNLFQKCPRANMNGYYMCKHKYVKIGEKNMEHTITPIHIIYYYRYIRFLQDGTVLYYVSNRKIQQQDIIKVLTKQQLGQQPTLPMVGEFMQFKNLIYFKTAKDNSVFCYQLEINSTDNKICNELKVLHYKLELVDKSDMNQTLFRAHPNKQDLTFTYFFNKDIQMQNSLRIQACSL